MIRTTAVRGRYDTLLGFVPDPEQNEKYVKSVLSVDAADRDGWHHVLLGAADALHEGFKKKTKKLKPKRAT